LIFSNMPVFTTLEGKWFGGPNSNVIRIEKQKDGSTRGDYQGKNKGRAGFEGKLLANGKRLKGYWFDLDSGVTEGHRYACTLEVFIDEQADPSGKTITAKCKTKDGGETEWTAKRHSETAAVPRNDGKIATFAFKTKAIFDRVTDNGQAKLAQTIEKERAEMIENADQGHPWFDGAIMYIPPPSIGAEYMNMTDLGRKLKAMEEEKAAKYKARLEEDAGKIKALMDAGKGDILKKRYNMDVDIAKRFIELYDKLLKGEAAGEKLKERPSFKPGMGPWHPDSEKPAEHMPDPYMTEFQLMCKLKKDESAHWAAFKAKLEAEIAWLTANQNESEKLKARGMDGDMAKRKIEIYTKMIKGEDMLVKLKERPSFKPNNPSWHPESEKPVEHLPDRYFSAAELERELNRREKKHWEEYKVKVENEIARLQKIGEDGEKLKKLALDADGAKRRIEIFTKILAGENRAAKLSERPKMKPNPPTVQFRMSGTVMLHPINVRKALSGRR